MIIAVGSHSRKIGKTSIICAIVRGTPEMAWTVVKISSNRRGMSGGCQCFEETAPGPHCDTARSPAAGAPRAYWLRAADPDMAAAAEFVRSLSAADRPMIVESNRIVEHVRPELYALALNFSVTDFKDSARRLFARADAFLAVRSSANRPRWHNVDIERLRTTPVYTVAPDDYRPRGLIRELRDRLGLPVTREAVA